MSRTSHFSSFGYPCHITLQPAGHYCGYVTVPLDHPASLVEDYMNLPYSVHGGVTFCESTPAGLTIGFDCAHGGDGYNSSLPGWRDYAYTLREVESLALQLAFHATLALLEPR